LQVEIDTSCIIGEKSFFEGRFAVKGSLKIDGQFEGEALLIDQLHIGPNAKVKTLIKATSIIVEGIVVGDLIASRRILLLSTARVLGNIKTPELIIQEGVVLEGKCTISHMKIENTKQYIEALYARETS
jgi:cytoskeletal protein CcmA (bactofilin family)